MYSRYQALIFDMDGTIINSLPTHQKAWEQILCKYKIPYTPKQMIYLNGWPSYQTVEYLCQQANITEMDIAQVSQEKEQLYNRLAPDSVTTTPVVDIVKEYASQKLLALGTGASTKEAVRLLTILGIKNYFQAIVGADQVIDHKPAPDTFLQCASLLAVKPEDCIVFEDAEAGFSAAKSAGMDFVDARTIWQGNYFINA
ncbi:MAG: Fructose-1-phosphate phosphatase YqaB [Candidatus Celerinatantimonas neptuna]|nr:MAG: Fructose-1-phosphate phosphatase YqaB [Candidatus Celerinatantimonas neptuna]